MRSSIKVLSIVLAFLLLVPFCVNVSADEAKNSYYEKLVAFGVMTEDDFLGEGETISRGYFTKFAVKLVGLTDSMISSANYENPFTDIETDVNANSIKAAYNLGLISGTTPGYFEPEKNITTAQAVKILVSALGYGGYATYEGGYPSGYLITADRIKLLKGVNLKTDDVLTWNNFTTLLYNAFNVDVLQGVGVVENGESIEAVMTSKNGENALALFYDIYGFEGLLESNEFTSLTGKSEVPAGNVSVSGTTLKLGKTEAYELIGCRVEGFYKRNDLGVKTIIYIEKDGDLNVEYTVKGDDIEHGGVSTSQFTYFEDGAKSSKKLTISNVAVLIYNGIQVEMNVELLKPANGFVTLIDNNRDTVIDVISVMNYTTIIVTGISNDMVAINGKDTGLIEIDSLSDDYFVRIRNGEFDVEFSELKVNDVISYAAYPSEDRYIKYLEVSSKSIVGTVEQIDGNGYATIDGAEYKYAADSGLALGVDGTFYQDFLGTIVRVDATKDFVYGFLNSVHRGTGLDSKVTVQIFSENGNWIETTLADKIKLDGIQGKTPAEFCSLYGTDYRQLVRYNVNSDGIVIEIDFAENETADTPEEAYRLSKTVSSATFYKGPIAFTYTSGNIGIWPGTTKIFSVPGESEKEDKDKFNVFDYSELINGGTYTNIQAYDADEIGIPNAVLLDENNQRITNSAVYIVEDVVTVLNEAGEAVPGIKAYFDGKNKLTLPLKDADVITAAGGVAKGDIIQCRLNPYNEVVKITKQFDYSEEYGNKFLRDKVYATTTFFAGTVEAIDYQRKRVKLNWGTNEATFSIEGITNMWIYDVDTGEVKIASIGQLQEDDYIYSRINTLHMREIVIFR